MMGALVLFLSVGAAAPLTGSQRSGALLNGHPLKLDAHGNIETWLPAASAHAEFVTRAMQHIKSYPRVDGLPPWLTHGQVPFYNNAHNPASLFAGHRWPRP